MVYWTDCCGEESYLYRPSWQTLTAHLSAETMDIFSIFELVTSLFLLRCKKVCFYMVKWKNSEQPN